MKIIIPSVLILFFSLSPLFANFAESYGVDAKGVAMGNAVCSLVDNWTSPFYNMAGLGKNPENENLNEARKENGSLEEFHANEIGFGFLYTKPQLGIKINTPDGAQETQDMSFGAITTGLVIDLTAFLKIPFDLNARFGVLLGILADGSVTNSTDDNPKTHYYLRYGRRIQRFFSNVGLGVEVWKDHLYLGGGVAILAGGTGIVEMEGVKMQSEEQSPPSRKKMNVNSSRAPLAGINFTWDNINVGAAYKAELYMSIDPITSSAEPELNAFSDTMRMRMSIVDFYTPPRYIIGGAYTLNILYGVTIALDLEYQMWSQFKLSSSYKSLMAAGYKGYEDPNFTDILIIKLGSEQIMYPWLTIREGYILQPTFTPDQDRYSNYLDNDKHIISVGAGFLVADSFLFKVPIEVNVTYQYQYLVPRKTAKTLDDTADYTYNPNYEYGGSVHTLFLSINFKW